MSLHEEYNQSFWAPHYGERGVPRANDLKGREWGHAQPRRRNFFERTVSAFEALERSSDLIHVTEYGAVDYGPDHVYPTTAVLVGHWNTDTLQRLHPNKKLAGLLGGEHAYEEGSIEGGFYFLQNYAERYADDVDIVANPLFNPSGYEIFSRFNRDKQNINRSWGWDLPSQEIQQFIAFIERMGLTFEDFDQGFFGHEQMPEDPIIKAMEGDPSLGDDLPGATYGLEDVVEGEPLYGEKITAGIERLVPLFRQAVIFQKEDEPGFKQIGQSAVYQGLADRIKTSSSGFWRDAGCSRVITMEPYAAYGLGMHERRVVQCLGIVNSLNALVGRVVVSPEEVLRNAGFTAPQQSKVVREAAYA